jgi:ubiquinone/menaquinone biosynthesis C-methylase UbiE
MIAYKDSIAFSGNIPDNYEKCLGPLFFEPFASVVAERIRQIQPLSVLEVACGTGRLTKYLPAGLSAGASITATDVNPAMLDYAKNILAEHKGIRWAVVDAVNLPYENEAFDSIISQFGVMFYSDRPKAYSEAYRTMKPGGTFFFTAWDKFEFNPAARLTNETLTEFFPIDTPAFYKVPFSYHDERQIHQDLASAGFKNIRMEILRVKGYADTAETAAKGLLEGTPVYTAIAERDETMFTPMRKALAEKLAFLLGNKNLSVPLQARLVTATK